MSSIMLVVSTDGSAVSPDTYIICSNCVRSRGMNIFQLSPRIQVRIGGVSNRSSSCGTIFEGRDLLVPGRRMTPVPAAPRSTNRRFLTRGASNPLPESFFSAHRFRLGGEKVAAAAGAKTLSIFAESQSLPVARRSAALDIVLSRRIGRAIFIVSFLGEEMQNP